MCQFFQLHYCRYWSIGVVVGMVAGHMPARYLGRSSEEYIDVFFTFLVALSVFTF